MFFLSWLGGEALSSVYDEATGKPDVREMQRQLDSLAAQKYADDKIFLAEIRLLRNSLDEKMTRKEVQDLIAKSIARLDRDLGKIADRMVKLEMAVASQGRTIERQQLKLQEIVGNAADTRRVVNEQGYRLDTVEADVEIIKQKVAKIQRWIDNIGIAAFGDYGKRANEEALEKFEDGIIEDSGEPAFYYGKAIVLYRTGEVELALRALQTGLNAERRRTPAEWFDDVMEKVQGKDRMWFSDTKKIYQAFTLKRIEQK